MHYNAFPLQFSLLLCILMYCTATLVHSISAQCNTTPSFNTPTVTDVENIVQYCAAVFSLHTENASILTMGLYNAMFSIPCALCSSFAAHQLLTVGLHLLTHSTPPFVAMFSIRCAVAHKLLTVGLACTYWHTLPLPSSSAASRNEANDGQTNPLPALRCTQSQYKDKYAHTHTNPEIQMHTRA